jgi:ABC-2 type transport system ATP-binding protein
MIETRGLRKSFRTRSGTVEAVRGIDLVVQEGEIFGFLGPNGAGKSTTISILCTLLAPTAGTARVAGIDVAYDPARVRQRIGLVFQDPSLDDQLTGRENLDFHAFIYSVPAAVRRQRIDEMLALVQLTDRAGSQVKTYSGGMKRRLEIARGMLHQPQILFLDEPTLGLDPQTRSHIWDYIRRLNRERQVTMMLTTHYMEEADELCNRIGIIDQGRIVAEGTPAQLKSGIGGDLVYLSLNGTSADLTPTLQGVPEVRSVKKVNEGFQLEVAQGETAIPRLLEAVRAQGGAVTSISLKKPTLNDVFIKHTGRGIRDEDMDAAGRMRFFMRGRRH